MNAWKPPDFLGEDLARLVAAADSSADSGAGARELLLAYGRCLVHDVPVTMPVPLGADSAAVGARELVASIEQATAGIDDSVEAWRDADDQFEREAIVGGLLELRMDAWYAAEAFEHLAGAAAGDSASRLREALRRLDAAAHAYSEALEANVDVLSTLASTPLLRNWRAMLPERHEQLPWWLDGTLEEAAIAVAREFDRNSGLFRASGKPAVIPSSRAGSAARASDAPLRRASAALAAAVSNQMVTGIEWLLPGTTLRATLYVPPKLEQGSLLSLALEDTAHGDAAFAAVGTVSFLNGEAVHWRLTGPAERPEVSGSLVWRGADSLADTGTLELLDGASGAPWVEVTAGPR